MKTLKTLLVVALIFSLTIHPTFINCLLAKDPVRVNSGDMVMPACNDKYQTPEETYAPPYTGDPIDPNTKYITAAEALLKIKGSPAITPEDQADAEKWLGIKPASVKLDGAWSTGNSSGERYLYYDADGNLVGSKTVKAYHPIGAGTYSETVKWNDKDEKEILTPTAGAQGPQPQEPKTPFTPSGWNKTEDQVVNELRQRMANKLGVSVDQIQFQSSGGSSVDWGNNRSVQHITLVGPNGACYTYLTDGRRKVLISTK